MPELYTGQPVGREHGKCGTRTVLYNSATNVQYELYGPIECHMADSTLEGIGAKNGHTLEVRAHRVFSYPDRGTLYCGFPTLPLVWRTETLDEYELVQRYKVRWTSKGGYTLNAI